MSKLFHGNPYLIEGFNTFLPPGYHISVLTDPHDPNLITVTTPLGTITSNVGAGMGGFSYFGSPLPFGPPATGSRPEAPLRRLYPPQTFSPVPQGLTTAVASVLGNMGNKTQVERAPAAEFDYASLYQNPPDGASASGAMRSHETTGTPASVPKGAQAPSRRRQREQPKEPAQVSGTGIMRKKQAYRSQRIPVSALCRGLPQNRGATTRNPRSLRVIKLLHHRCISTTTNRMCPGLAITSKVITWHRSAASFSACMIEY